MSERLAHQLANGIVIGGGLLSYYHTSNLFVTVYSHLYNPVATILEKIIRFVDPTQRVTVRNKRRGIDLPRLDHAENLGAVATVHASRPEREVFPYMSGSGNTCGLS